MVDVSDSENDNVVVSRSSARTGTSPGWTAETRARPKSRKRKHCNSQSHDRNDVQLLSTYARSGVRIITARPTNISATPPGDGQSTNRQRDNNTNEVATPRDDPGTSGQDTSRSLNHRLLEFLSRNPPTPPNIADDQDIIQRHNTTINEILNKAYRNNEATVSSQSTQRSSDAGGTSGLNTLGLRAAQGHPDTWGLRATARPASHPWERGGAPWGAHSRWALKPLTQPRSRSVSLVPYSGDEQQRPPPNTSGYAYQQRARDREIRAIQYQGFQANISTDPWYVAAQPGTSSTQAGLPTRIMDTVHIQGVPAHVTRDMLMQTFGIDVIHEVSIAGTDAFVQYKSPDSAGRACVWFDKETHWGATLRVQLTETVRSGQTGRHGAQRQIQLGRGPQQAGPSGTQTARKTAEKIKRKPILSKQKERRRENETSDSSDTLDTTDSDESDTSMRANIGGWRGQNQAGTSNGSRNVSHQRGKKQKSRPVVDDGNSRSANSGAVTQGPVSPIQTYSPIMQDLSAPDISCHSPRRSAWSVVGSAVSDAESADSQDVQEILDTISTPDRSASLGTSPSPLSISSPEKQNLRSPDIQGSPSSQGSTSTHTSNGSNTWRCLSCGHRGNENGTCASCGQRKPYFTRTPPRANRQPNQTNQDTSNEAGPSQAGLGNQQSSNSQQDGTTSQGEQSQARISSALNDVSSTPSSHDEVVDVENDIVDMILVEFELDLENDIRVKRASSQQIEVRAPDRHPSSPSSLRSQGEDAEVDVENVDEYRNNTWQPVNNNPLPRNSAGVSNQSQDSTAGPSRSDQSVENSSWACPLCKASNITTFACIACGTPKPTPVLD